MVFFDLNIPYHESERNLSTRKKASLKATRLKLLTKSLELGYTGAAYNRTITAPISKLHASHIPLFTLPSILQHSPPSLPASLKLHRHLLDLPLSSPFRQYTRLTLLVSKPPHFDALNPDNELLRTYDFIAVTPLNQEVFQYACQTAKVDIISIDFSAKLPFQLKKSWVEGAVKRGVYFEIKYSCLIFDAQARTQMIPNAKLLVDWTRGKNLIISSGAPSITELRGPYDVANLSSLFGLTMERAKAAMSKNCRSVVANALRRKHFWKEVVRVEKLPPGEEMNFDDWLKWDPISTAEGELSLDDMGKSFSASYNTLKVTKAIDFASDLNGVPSHGLQIKDIISSKVPVAEPYAVSRDFTTELVLPEQPLHFRSLHKKEPAVAEGLVEPSGSDLEFQVSPSCDLSSFVSFERHGVDAISIKQLENVHVLDSKIAEPKSLQALSCTARDERNALLRNEAVITCAENTNIVSSHGQCASARKSIPANGFNSSPFDCDQSKLLNSARLDIVTQGDNVGRSLVAAIPDTFEELHEIEAESVSRSDKELPLASSDESLQDDTTEIERSLKPSYTSNQTEGKRVSRNDKELPPVLYEESFHDKSIGRDRFLEERDTVIVLTDGLPVKKFDDHMIIDNEHLICNEAPSTQSYESSLERISGGEDKEVGTSDLSVALLDEPHMTQRLTENAHSVAQDETVEQEILTSHMQTDGQGGTNSEHPDHMPIGRGGVKRKTYQLTSLFPFKRLISPRPSRKKARK